MITLYHQTKTSIGFWYRQGLNSKSLIQPSETLPVKLTGIHKDILALGGTKKKVRWDKKEIKKRYM